MNYYYLALGIILLYLLAQIAFTGYYYIKGINLSKITYTGTFQFNSKFNSSLKLAIVGDSVAAGVGSSSLEKSVAGRIAIHLAKKNKVFLENNGVSGAKIKDLNFIKAPKSDITVMIISSNDLFHFTNLKEFETQAEKVIKKYQNSTKRLIILGPLRIETASSIPIFLKPIYKNYGFKYIKILEEIAKKYPNVFHTSPYNLDSIDSYSSTIKDYGNIEANDRFHPNDEGHRFYSDMIIKEINQ